MAPIRPSKAAQPAPPARAPQPKRPPAPVSAIAALQSRVGNAGLQQLLAQRADASSAKGPLAPGPTASASAPIMGATATAKTPPTSASGAPVAPAGRTDTIAESAAPAGGGAKVKSGAAAEKAGAAPAARAPAASEAGGKAGGPGAVSPAAAHAAMAGTIHAVHARAAGACQHPKRKTPVQAAEAAGTVPALEHRREADRQQVHDVGAVADTIEKVKRDEFKKKLADAIAASMQQPKTEAAADRVMKQGAADANKTLRTQLATEQEATAGPLKTATQQDSLPAQGSPEAPTLAPLPIGAPPPPVPAAGAVPAPLPPEQLDYSSDRAPTERAMAENNVTQEQLEEGNEPAFGPALSAHSAAEKHEAEAPGRYRQAEGAERDKATGVAQQALSQGLAGTHGARTIRLGKVSAQQQDTRDKNLAERKRITDHIAAIKNATLRQVTRTLDAMERDAVKIFEAGLARAEKAYADTFEEEKGGIGTWLTTWGSDWEEHIEHSLGKAKEAYDKQVTVAIDEVATYVDDQLAAARRLVVQGRVQVEGFVQGLGSEVKQYGEEALQTVGSEFDQMEGDIDRRRDSLVDKLTQQYRASHERMAAMEEKLREENKSLWQRVYDATIGLIKKIVAFAEMLLSVLARAAAVVGDIIRHPIRFLGNLVSAVKLGVTNFSARIGEHLKQGFMEWLFGVVGAAGIELPKSFDLKSILRLVLQLLGLTWPNIRARAVALLGEKVVAALETASEIFTKLVTEGPGALWQWIQDKLDLKGMVFEKIMDFLVQRVIVAGITWIIGLLNPASAFLKACKAIYDIVVFFVERAAQIAALVNAVLDSIAAIVAGGIAAAAAKVEDALARAIPVVIGFLAGLLGLGGLSEKIKSIVEAIRKPINTAIDWVIGKAVMLVKAAGKAAAGLFGGGKEKDKDDDKSIAVKKKVAAELAGKTIKDTDEEKNLLSSIYNRYAPQGLKGVRFAPNKEHPGSIDVIASASLAERVAQINLSTDAGLKELGAIIESMVYYSGRTTIYVFYDLDHKSFGGKITNAGPDEAGHAEHQLRNVMQFQLLPLILLQRLKKELKTPVDEKIPIHLDINRSPCDGCAESHLQDIVKQAAASFPELRIALTISPAALSTEKGAHPTTVKGLKALLDAGVELTASTVWTEIEKQMNASGVKQIEYRGRAYDIAEIARFKLYAKEVQDMIDKAKTEQKKKMPPPTQVGNLT